MEQGKNRFQVGGSISEKSSIYIKRAADVELFEALKRQELCYVFNSRQVGKSSLLVSVKSALMELGFKCCFLDMSRIGSIQPTQEQWYAGIISELWRGFSLPKGQAMFEWWNEQGDIPAAQKFSHFIQDKLPRSLPDLEMVIFIDEIDSVLSLPFPADDFFSVIRASFNQRADQLAQNVVNFAFFGVALPSDLVSEPSRSPFNIGTAIKLEGFTLPEATPLASGLKIEEKSALAVLSRIIYWTGGQPFLTQKVCQLINNQLEKQNIETLSDTGTSLEDFVDTSIYEHIIDSWENKDNPEHLKTIMDRLLHDEAYSTLNLDLYSQLLKTGSYQIDSNGDDSWRHLYLTGIISHHENTLRVRTRIYREVFNSDWIDDLLEKKRPYSEAFKLWHKTNDDAYLLSGEALSDAKAWSENKHLPELDYRFIAASQTVEQKKVEESNTRLIEEVKNREQAEKELKNTLELLREANTRIESANSAKSNFVTRVSKEVRTPINSILGLGFLAMQHDSSPLIQDYLSKIYRSAGYLLNVVNDIVDINKLERNELTLVHETFWLDDIIDNVIDIIAPKMHENSVELKVELPSTPPIVGDPVRLQQLILNLMSNAIRFTEEGTISLKVGVLSSDHNQINLSFIIKDSGIGFSAKKISCTLNKEQKGHLPIGLGLEFCTDLLSLWGSELDIQSTPRVGSRLQFDLKFKVDTKTDDTSIHDLFTVAIIGSKPFMTQLTGQVQSLSHQVIDAGQDLSDLQKIASNNKQLKIDKVLLEFTDNASRETLRQLQDLKPKVDVIPVIHATNTPLNWLSSMASSYHLSVPCTSRRLQNTLEKRSLDTDYLPTAPMFSKSYRILVAEDDEVNQQIVTELLIKQGLVVTVVGNGIEAVNKLAEKHFDLAFMDIEMPYKGGLEAIKEIRALSPIHGTGYDNSKIPVIAMTALAMSNDRERFLMAGMDDYITKPLDPDTISKLLVKWLPGVQDVQTLSTPNDHQTLTISDVDTHEGILCCGGNTQLYKELLVKFARQHTSPIDYKQLTTADLYTSLHTIKGTAANLGLSSVALSAGSLESLCRLKRWPSAYQLDDFSNQLQKTCSKLLQHSELATVVQQAPENAPEPPSIDRVLIISDDFKRLRALINELKQRYKVSIATDFQNAHSILQQVGQANTICISSSEDEMGNAIDFIQQIKTQNPGTHFCMLTEPLEEQHYQKGLAAGVNDFFVHPLSPSLILHRLPNPSNAK